MKGEDVRTEPSTRTREGRKPARWARWGGRLGGALLAALLLPAGPELSVAVASAEPQTRTEAAGGDPSPARERFFDRVDVNVVNVEVYVTDKQGAPVSGLTREDFELFVDGDPVELSNFYAIQAGEPAPWERAARPTPGETPSEDGAETETTPRTLTVPSPAPPPEERRLHLVVYVDQLNIKPSSRNRVLEGLELFLEERLTAGDRVMVVSSYPAFRVVQGFTEDRQKVLDGVRDLQTRTASGLFQERRVILSQLSTAADTDDPLTLDALRRTTLSSIRQYTLRASQELGMEIEKLRGLVGSFAGLPGRKAVLHVSDGIPSRPGEDLFALWESVFAAGGEGLAGDYRGRVLETANDDLAPRIQELVRDANAQSVTFYTLEAGGRDRFGISAESRGITSTGTRFGGPEVAAIAQANEQSSLQQLAGGTGGVPILNANQPWVNLEQMADTFDTWYSLGFTPADDKAGKYHRLEVKVRRPGLRVRHRQGYKEETTEERIENATVAALLLGRWKNPMRAYLEVGKPQRKGKKRYEVPLAVKIPLDRVTLLPGPDSHRGLLRVRVAFQGTEGTGFGVGDELKVPIEIPDGRLEQARSQHFTVTVSLELDPGLHRLAVGVWDEVAAEASYLPYDVMVEKG